MYKVLNPKNEARKRVLVLIDAKCKIWVDSKGKVWHFEDMSERHINNCIKVLYKQNIKWGYKNRKLSMIIAFEEELLRRKRECL